MTDWVFEKQLQEDITYLEKKGCIVLPMSTMGIDIGFSYWRLIDGDDVKHMIPDSWIVAIAAEKRKSDEANQC